MAKAKTRRRISADSRAVRVDNMGSENSRVSDELSLALKRAQLAKLNDPFSKLVNDLDSKVKFMKSQETFKKLAEGDPKSFIRDAEEKLAGMSADDPQRRLWEAALKQAKEKVEDQQWSNDLKLGLKTYEEWKAHLEGKLSSERPGSPEASELIQAIASANKAATARDEAKRDQDALLAYANSKDADRHEKYRTYLQGKFLRVKDGGVQQEIIKQMGQLDERKAKEESIGRAQKKSDIITDYQLNGGAGEAIKKLQELARDPKITKEEVDAIQRSVESVIKREEDRLEDAAKKAKGSSSSGAKAAGDAINSQVNEAERDYEKVKSQIDKVLIEGGVPTKEMVADLEAYAAVLEATYNAAGKAHPNIEASDKLLKAAINVDENVSKIKVKIDTEILKDADLSTAGKTAFAAAVAAASAGKDGDAFTAAANVAHARLTALVRAKDKLVTVGARDAAATEIDRVASLERKQIANLAGYAPKDTAAISELDAAYRLYRESTGVKDGDKLESGAFKRALLEATSVDEILSKLGFKDNKAKAKKTTEETDIFGNVNKKTQTVDVERFTLESFTKLKTAAEKAEGRRDTDDIGEEQRLWTRLVRTPGVKVSPEEKYNYDMYGVGGILDEDAKNTRARLVTNPLSAMEPEEYLDIVQGRGTKGPAGAMARPMSEEDQGLVTPEAIASEGAQISEFEPGTGLQAERPAEPTINELAPEEAPGDFKISEGESWETRDPVEAAFEYLDRAEAFDLQGLTIPTLPEDDSISPFRIEEFDNPWDKDDDKEDEDDDDKAADWNSSLTEFNAGDSRTDMGGRGSEEII